MSEWKSAGDRLNYPGAKVRSFDHNIQSLDEGRKGGGVTMALKSIIGFFLLITINAFAAFCATRLLGVEIAYWRCALLAVVWVVFRTYDKLWIDSLREATKK